jgi:small subunit ribosomal protein S17
MTTKVRGLRKSREGVVVSDRADKTVAVLVERTVRHPVYGRVIKRRKRYLAHDETNECHMGDLVRIIECRPMSATKTWRVVEILRHSSLAEAITRRAEVEAAREAASEAGAAEVSETEEQ